MSTTSKQDNDFLQSVVGTGLLESAIDWIQSNLSVTEVFTEKELISWASDQKVDDIFSQRELDDWATSNGYIKE